MKIKIKLLTIILIQVFIIINTNIESLSALAPPSKTNEIKTTVSTIGNKKTKKIVKDANKKTVGNGHARSKTIPTYKPLPPEELQKRRSKVNTSIKIRTYWFFIGLGTIFLIATGITITGTILISTAAAALPVSLTLIISGSIIGVLMIVLFVIKLITVNIAEKILLFLGHLPYYRHKAEKSSNDVYFLTNEKKAKKLYGKYFSVNNPKGSILISYGNGFNVGGMLDAAKFFNNLGLDVFIYDYPGYGRSKGKPSETALYRSAEAAYEQMKESYKQQHGKTLEDKKIIVAGHSLGAAVANYLAYTKNVGAFLSISGFTSIGGMVNDISPIPIPFAGLFTSNQFNAKARIGDIKCPQLIMHSKNDSVVPYKMAKKLAIKSEGASTFNSTDVLIEMNIAASKTADHDLNALLEEKKEDITKFLQKNIDANIGAVEKLKQQA